MPGAAPEEEKVLQHGHLVAPVRLVFLVLCVGPHVVSDVAFERLVADVALVQPLVLVEGQDVTLQGVGSRVCLVAKMTPRTMF